MIHLGEDAIRSVLFANIQGWVLPDVRPRRRLALSPTIRMEIKGPTCIHLNFPYFELIGGRAQILSIQKCRFGVQEYSVWAVWMLRTSDALQERGNGKSS